MSRLIVGHPVGQLRTVQRMSPCRRDSNGLSSAAIVSGKCSCLTNLRLRGAGGPSDRDRKAALEMELRAVLGEDIKIVVEKAVD